MVTVKKKKDNEAKDYYDLNKWRENKANHIATSAISRERLFVIRNGIKKFIDKWGDKTDYRWYELDYWKKGDEKERKKEQEEIKKNSRGHTQE